MGQANTHPAGPGTATNHRLQRHPDRLPGRFPVPRAVPSPLQTSQRHGATAIPQRLPRKDGGAAPPHKPPPPPPPTPQTHPPPPPTKKGRTTPPKNPPADGCSGNYADTPSATSP